MSDDELISGVLVIYRHPLGASEPTILEHVEAFEKYSRFPVWNVNTELGFPKVLGSLRFKCIVLHYSLFGSYPFGIDREFWTYLKSSHNSVIIAFFQDEMQYCGPRFQLIDQINVRCIYSLLDPSECEKIYLENTRCGRIRHTLTGYVDDDFVKLARKIEKPFAERTVDIGYRTRRLPFHFGRGAQEKTDIAEGAMARLNGSNLVLDIKTGTEHRIHGTDWYKFVANCRGMLGVEAGVSIFDLDGQVRTECDRVLKRRPEIDFKEMSRLVLQRYENNVYYRTISPRIFESAALRVCMILFEGRYNDLLEPMVHYIPLKKDFSNFEWVIDVFTNPVERDRITEVAYSDLISSGRVSYRRFIAAIDQELAQFGLSAVLPVEKRRAVSELLDRAQIEQTGKAERRAGARRIAKQCIPNAAPFQKIVSSMRSWIESRRWRNV